MSVTLAARVLPSKDRRRRFVDEPGAQFDADPGQQIDLPATTIFEPGNFTLTFVPSEAALFKKFDTRLHRAEVIYWKIIEGRQRPLSYTWTFNVI